MRKSPEHRGVVASCLRRCLGAATLHIYAASGNSASTSLRPCPAEDAQTRSVSRQDAKTVPLSFVNLVTPNRDVDLFWVDGNGNENPIDSLGSGATHSLNTFAGHVFNVRDSGSGRLMLSHRVAAGAGTRPIQIQACLGMAEGRASLSKALPQVPPLDQSHWPEFELLVHDQHQQCVGPSSKWSCIRFVSEEEVARRDPTAYGFTAEEAAGSPYRAGTTRDHIHNRQIRLIPNMTAYSGGFLKMDFPQKLKALLLPWYANRQRYRRDHGNIPGFFTNTHKVKMEKINLDEDPSTRNEIVKVMQNVLQWWTNTSLKHSTTFGLRIYKRGAMLLNHVDRKDTHIASAVMQVAQDIDEDGGWPLEAIHPHERGVYEVYLQPGEMVLYEGARIIHGRPMRLKGEDFGSIFTHFAPTNWKLSETKANPHFTARPATLEL